jgi:hypothetical protein
MSIIKAPFTKVQINHLWDYQLSGRMHPFTCGKRDNHPENEGILVPTFDGWVCPVDGCGYTQDWAHEFMTKPLPKNPLFNDRTGTEGSSSMEDEGAKQ